MSCICGQSERILSNQMLISLYRHAEIFTTEEACRIAREKLVKLRTLYLNQYHRLGYVLRARRGESTWSQNARCIAASPISPGTRQRNGSRRGSIPHTITSALMPREASSVQSDRFHAGSDRKQVLFRTCGIEKGGIECHVRTEPVPMIFDDATCPLHIKMPPERSY